MSESCSDSASRCHSTSRNLQASKVAFGFARSGGENSVCVWDLRAQCVSGAHLYPYSCRIPIMYSESLVL
jgi:hypothetical protein